MPAMKCIRRLRLALRAKGKWLGLRAEAVFLWLAASSACLPEPVKSHPLRAICRARVTHGTAVGGRDLTRCAPSDVDRVHAVVELQRRSARHAHAHGVRFCLSASPSANSGIIDCRQRHEGALTPLPGTGVICTQ